MPHLFGTQDELLVYGARHYHIRSTEASMLLLQLFRRIRQEIQTVSTPPERFVGPTIEELLKELPPEHVLEALPIENYLDELVPRRPLQGLSVGELLEMLRGFRKCREEMQPMSIPSEEVPHETVDELLKALPVEKRLEGLTPEQRVQGLSREELLKLAEKLKGNGTSSKA